MQHAVQHGVLSLRPILQRARVVQPQSQKSGDDGDAGIGVAKQRWISVNWSSSKREDAQLRGRAALAAERTLELAAVSGPCSTTRHETRRSTTDARARFEAELPQLK